MFLKEQFGIHYNENNLYTYLGKDLEKLKEKIHKQIVELAKREFGFDFSFVLYDVTTLYFESFKNDEFKRPGFLRAHLCKA